MKNALIVTALLLLGAGCELPDAAVSPTEPSEQNEIETAVFDVAKIIPDSAIDQNVDDLDLDGDGVMEKLVTYTVKDERLLAWSSTRDTVYYLRVYRSQDGEWQAIKEDQKIENFYGQAGDFCVLKIVRFDLAPRDYLLVSKCHAFGANEGYYLFGEVASGVFDDVSIPKAYLHESDYLQEGERWLGLEGVEAVADGLIEHYGVACDAKPDTYSHFGGDDSGYCRMLDVRQQFDGRGFGAPVVVIKTPPTYPANGVLFDPNTVAIGEQVGGMTLDAIGTNGQSFVFTGTIELIGTYYIIPEDDPFFPGTACFEDLNADSLTRIPDAEGDGRTIWFCFSNQDEALAMFEETEGTATITISRYVIDLRETEVVNSAVLVSVTE